MDDNERTRAQDEAGRAEDPAAEAPAAGGPRESIERTQTAGQMEAQVGRSAPFTREPEISNEGAGTPESGALDAGAPQVGSSDEPNDYDRPEVAVQREERRIHRSPDVPIRTRTGLGCGGGGTAVLLVVGVLAALAALI